MSGADEEWVQAAMSDDNMVVQLLVQLNHTPPVPAALPKRTSLPLGWTVRQRRSKSVSLNRKHRGSPTTPLSWSAATSFSGGSGGATGFEESSRPPPFKLSDTTRSKVNGDSEKTPSKRSRKKKTLAQLKEEENSLVRERRELNKEIAFLRVNVEKQRATNERLKRMKLEMQPHSHSETGVLDVSVSDQLSGHPLPSAAAPPVVFCNNVALQPSTSNGCPEQNADAATNPKFVLPDLNMPFEDLSSDVICQVS